MPGPLAVTLADQRRDRTSLKWRLYPDVLPLWVAEMDVIPCPPVVEAVTSAVRRGDLGYPMLDQLSEAFRGFAASRWGWTVEPGQVQVVCDVMSGVAESLRVVTDPGGPVVVNPPCYDSFVPAIEGIGRRAVAAPLGDDGRLDLEAVERAYAHASASGGRVAHLLCNPQNPTGTVHTAEELTTLADLARRHGVRVVSDEIHAPVVYAPHRFVSYASIDPRGVAITSAGKGWNIPALKAAVVVRGSVDEAPDPLPEFFTHAASHLGVIGQAVAFGEGATWQLDLLDDLDANRHLLARVMARRLPDVGFVEPEATYLAWLDFRPAGLGDDPAVTLRERAGVALSSGVNYDTTGGRGFARLNFATSPEILTEAVERIAAVL